MSSPTQLALIGAGAIAKTHLESAVSATKTQFVAIADPRPETQQLAEQYGLKWFANHMDLLDNVQPDGVVIAVPNALHEAVAGDALQKRIPVLLEKPIAESTQQGLNLARLSDTYKTPLLVAHHRRHNPIIKTVRDLIQKGLLGQIIGINSLISFYKPDAYFEQTWRQVAGGGPVLINLIHEIDLLRFFLGEIKEVQAITSNAIRQFEVEDSAAVMLQFENGSIATLLLSDSAVSPWSWELTSKENPFMFPSVAQSSHHILGTKASLSLPDLTLWRYASEPSWSQPLLSEPITPITQELSTYEEQLRHFGAVIRHEETPIIDALDATHTLAATLRILDSNQKLDLKIQA